MKIRLKKDSLTEDHELSTTIPQVPYLKVVKNDISYYAKLGNSGASKFTFDGLKIISDNDGGVGEPISIDNFKLVSSSWTPKSMLFSWDCNAVCGESDYFQIGRDSASNRARTKENRYEDTEFNRWTFYNYSVFGVFNGVNTNKLTLMVRTPRTIEGIYYFKEVYPVHKSKVPGVLLNNKEYVCFMPPGTYFLGDNENVDIIEID